MAGFIFRSLSFRKCLLELGDRRKMFVVDDGRISAVEILLRKFFLVLGERYEHDVSV